LKKTGTNFIISKTGLIYLKDSIECWKPAYLEYLDGKSLKVLEGLLGISEGTFKKYFLKFGFSLRNAEESKEQRVKTNILKYGVPYVLQSKEIKDKGITTNREKYGTDYASQAEEIRDKIKDTNLERYGFSSATKSEKVKDKIKATCIHKYGVEYAVQSKESVAKKESTNLERYGVINPFQSEDIKNKIKKTNLDKYGFSSATQSELIKSRIRKTNLEKYGCIHALQTEESMSKLRSTNIFKYGYPYAMQSSKIASKVRKFKKESVLESIKNRFNSKESEYTLLDSYKGVFYNVGNKLKWVKYSVKHRVCGSVFKSAMKADIKCPICFPQMRGESQSKIQEFINSLNIDTVVNDRGTIYPLEIDILIPKLGIGFEYNGSYYHSSKFKVSSSYHKVKTESSLAKEIKLYHIWEHDNEDIIKSMIRSTLGRCECRYHARKLKVKEVSIRERRDFFNNNHLHGDVSSNLALGLYEGSKLVSCISFRKCREIIEIARFATLLNSSCVGGFSRLLKSSIHEYKMQGYTKIITYCDRDWTPNYKDSVYFKNGFRFIGDTGVQLKYYNERREVVSREKYQKHKLKKMFPKSYSDTKTADQILEENSIYSIHNSGNWKFEMDI